jgi:hypothetical protein
MRHTQSFHKDMIAYLAGNECGNLIEAKYVYGKLFEPSKDQALGQYFEYELAKRYGLEALPKDGKVPQAEMMASGKDKMAPYRLADVNVQRVVNYLLEMGLNPIMAGIKLTKGNREGTIDLVCEATKKAIIKVSNTGEVIKLKKGDRIVIDVKYSGLIEKGFQDFGWDLLNNPKQREYHGIQAKQYHYISSLPFFFLVVSSKNDVDIRFFYVSISEQAIEAHIKEGNELIERFEYEKSIGFQARPEVGKCSECPLKVNCRDKSTVPDAIQINF